MNNPQVIIQASKCVCLLSIIQNELTLLEGLGYTMKQDLKHKANLFKGVLDKEIERFYGNMPESAQLQYFNLTNELEGAINERMLELFKDRNEVSVSIR